ncbi:hypothetical protein CAI16_16500 [Virgibacillus dokdonensis]|uniref:Uncharacterized protein n=1 Tax=Virgibacillus dokdonensis TaxID=302167 RepID=A0A3E0WL85_9BACI|nr:glycine cleavage T C-terminal barrel domain-containing protein [Virgibacillus dokdonensis]RFA32963.1 hypothetical protein CAI16_16500 [Virgibacillus dokdonensis]
MSNNNSPELHVEVVNGKEVCLAYTDVNQEYQVIREEVGLLDFSFTTKLKVSGDRAADFLQQLITKDLDFLSEEQTLTCLLLEEDGSLVGEVTIYVLQDSYLLDVWPSFAEDVKAYLSKKVEGSSEVEMEDITSHTGTFLLEGPKSWKVVQEFLPISVQVIPFQNFSYFEYMGKELIIARIGYSAEYGYKVIGDKDVVNKLNQELLDMEFSDINVQRVGLNSLEICRLEVRFPNLSRELDPNQQLLELGINWLIDFNKDFPGKEKLMESLENGLEKRAVCFISEGLDIKPKDKIVVDGETIGYIQHTLYSPSVNNYVGIAYLNIEYAAAGFSFLLENGNTIKSVSSPIVQAKSLSIRME